MIEKREIGAVMKAVSRVVKEYVADAVAGVAKRVDDLERRQAEMPVPRDGKDADPEFIRAAVHSEVEQLAASRVVKDYVMETVSGVSKRMDDLMRRQDAMPVPKDGKDADPELVRAAVHGEVEQLAGAFVKGLE